MRAYIVYNKETGFVDDVAKYPVTFDTFNGAKICATELFKNDVYSIIGFDMDSKELLSAETFNFKEGAPKITYLDKLEEQFYDLEFPAT